MSQYRDVDVEPGTKVRIALMQDGTLRWTVLRATTCAVTGKEFWQVDRKAVTCSYFDKVISVLAGFTHDGPVGQGGCGGNDAAGSVVDPCTPSPRTATPEVGS